MKGFRVFHADGYVTRYVYNGPSFGWLELCVHYCGDGVRLWLGA